MARFKNRFIDIDPGIWSRPAPPPPEFTHRSIGRPPREQVVEGDSIQILWPREQHGRARTVVTRSGAHRRFVVPCFRGGDREAHCDAAEERDLAILLDACAGIEFQDQPATIVFEFNGQETEHEPDFLAIGGSRRVFIECKKDQESLDLYIRCRTTRLRELLHPLGFEYQLVTTSQLQVGAYLENARRMRRRANVEFDLGELRQHMQSAASAPVIAGPLLSESASKFRAEPQTVLYAALYQGVLIGDLSEEISLNMTVEFSVHPGERPWLWYVLPKIS